MRGIVGAAHSGNRTKKRVTQSPGDDLVHIDLRKKVYRFQAISRRFIFILLLANTASVFAAKPPANAMPPSSVELVQLLSGNSNDGVWEGRAYRQYFSPDGSTRYQEENSRPSSGSWKVNDSGEYCSIWPPSSRWVCYKLLIHGNDIYWQSGEKYFHARVIQGNIFQQ